jgi:hypothetical protein
MYQSHPIVEVGAQQPTSQREGKRTQTGHISRASDASVASGKEGGKVKGTILITRIVHNQHTGDDAGRDCQEDVHTWDGERRGSTLRNVPVSLNRTC